MAMNEKEKQLQQITNHLKMICQPGEVYEIRAIDYRKNTSGKYKSKPAIYGAYFAAKPDQYDATAQWILTATNDHAPGGVYITINPALPDLIQRRSKPDYGIRTTADDEIQSRRRLIIDVDASKDIADLPATDAERQEAISNADAVREYLSKMGFPTPATCNSGNGGSIYYAIDLPNDDTSRDMIKALLDSLATVYPSVDNTMFNASRIARVSGTWNRKGDNLKVEDLPDGAEIRPWRLAELTNAPDGLAIVGPETIQAVIDDLSAAPEISDLGDSLDQSQSKPTATAATIAKKTGFVEWEDVHICGGSFEKLQADEGCIKAYLSRHGVNVVGSHNKDGGVWLELDKCPVSGADSENAKDINIFVGSNGRIIYKNHHKRGANTGWLDLRDKLEPGYKNWAQTYDSRKEAKKRMSNKSGPIVFTQTWAAMRFDVLIGEDYLYSPLERRWYLWTGKFWKTDKTNRFKADIFIDRFIPALRDAYAGTDAAGDIEDFITKKLSSNAAIDGIINLLQPRLSIEPSIFDRDIHSFNVGNGTVDLRTGELRQHRRRDHFSTILDINYDPAAVCPIWEKSLMLVTSAQDGTPRPDLYFFLQQCLGYCITGDTTEQVFFLAHGRGKNGKTFTLEYVRDILDHYGCAAPQSILTTNSRMPTSNHYDEAVLHSKRMALVSETKEGEKLDTPKVKRLTGNKRIRARNPYGQFFEFSVTHKLWIDCNYRPRITEMDDGTWRRIVVIPFDYQINSTEIDRRIDLKWDQEKQGILTWLVQGAIRFYQEGLSTRPECCKNAIEEYHKDSDYLVTFLDDCLNKSDDGNFLCNDDYYAAFKCWAKENGYHDAYIANKQTLTKKLIDRGISKGIKKIEGVTKRGIKGYYLTSLGTEYANKTSKYKYQSESGKTNDIGW